MAQDVATTRKLLNSPLEEERLEGLKALLARPPANLDEVLKFIAQRDTSARIRYAARKALDLWSRRKGAPPAAPPPPQDEKRVTADLSSEDPDVRSSAAQQIRAAGSPGLLQSVRQRLSVEQDAEVRARLLSIFERSARREDLPTLLPFLKDPDHRVRANAVLAVSQAEVRAAAPHIIALLGDTDHRVRANCMLALSPLDPAEVLLCLERMLAEESVAMRDAAVFAMSRLREPTMVPLLQKALTDRNPMVRQKAEGAIREMAEGGLAEAARLLQALSHPEQVPQEAAEVPDAVADRPVGPGGLEDPNPKVRLRCLTEAIFDHRTEMAPEIVSRLEREQNDFVLSKLLVALGKLGGKEHVKVVSRYVENPDPRIASTAIDALTALKAHELRGPIRRFASFRHGRVRAAAVLFLAHAEPGFDVADALDKMLTAREFELRLAGLYVLEQLGRGELTHMLEPLLADLSEHVRQKAFALLERLAGRGDTMAQDLLEMCRQGFVDRKERSLKFERAPFNKRLLALAEDFILAGLAYLACCFCVGVFMGAVGGAEGLGKILLSVTLFGVVFGFFVRDGCRDGRGFGKRRVGLRVVDVARCSSCSKGKSLIRSAFLGVPILNLVETAMAAFDPKGRRLADKILDTQVIDETGVALTEGQRLGVGVAYFVLVLGLIGAVWQTFGWEDQTAARTLRLKTGIDGPAAGWSVEGVAEGQAALSRKSFMKGTEATLSLRWKQLPSEVLTLEPKEMLETMVKGGVEGIEEEVAGAKGKMLEKKTRIDKMADGTYAATLNVEFEIKGNKTKLRMIMWPRQRWLVTAHFSSKEPKELEKLDADVRTLLGQSELGKEKD